MDTVRFQNATKLHDDGYIAEAVREFHAIAEDGDDSDERAAILGNVVKCYCRAGDLGRADEVLRQIRGINIKDRFVQLSVDFADACTTDLKGEHEDAVAKFGAILERNQSELEAADWRGLYERIQERRAFALVRLGRYHEALPILKEAVSFTDEEAEPQFVHFYLGVCYDEASESKLARDEYLTALRLGLAGHFGGSARYRLAMIYFKDGALAQAKLHLEFALTSIEGESDPKLKKSIYEGLARTCHFLAELEDEQKYQELARSM